MVKKIERKIVGIRGEDQFGFRRGKENKGAVEMLRIISEGISEIDEKLCVCFIDWQKAFDRLQLTLLMQILKETDIDWSERN